MSASTPDLKTIFGKALGIVEPADRARYLAEACGDNAELRAEVESLLQALVKAGSFLEAPAQPLGQSGDPPPIREGPGAVIGPYKLLQQIGEGGMGTVFMAEQTQPVQRKVALKLIKPGMDSAQVIARFEAERQALALMDHPNIAKVHDAGTTGGEPGGVSPGTPYFVMELVRGVPITQYCDEHRLTLRQRLELFIPVCRAVQHAHLKGIIHRDLKPSNVLVPLYDGRPVPKVIDFGVAKATGPKLTERTLFTEFGAIVGTLEYMSPEQAQLNQLDIDTRSDIYSLGVLLYELLTGTTPLEGKRLKEAALLEVLRVIREEEPPRPSTRLSTTAELPAIATSRGLEPKKLSGLVRGELDWIAMKCLEKDRGRRYETANGLAMDLERYLCDEPVQACPPSAGYRLRKFARRNRRALATAALVGLILLAAVGVVAGSLGWVARDRAARQAAVERQVIQALEEATTLQQRERWTEAMAAMKRAEGLLATGGASEGLRRQVDQGRADLEMITRLEEIRLERAAVKDGRFDVEGTDAAYDQAFWDYGLNLEALEPDEGAQRVRASAIKDRLVVALDDWVLTRQLLGRPNRQRLLAILQRADDDPWRNRLREALQRRDRQALEELGRDKELLAQPPVSVLLLAIGLHQTGQVPQAVEVLRQAQVRHPHDFWINNHLAYYLLQMEPAAAAEAVGFYRAALALRPDNPGVHLNVGFVLRNQGQLTEAEAAYRQALGLKPDYAEALLGLAVILEQQGKLAEAEAAYGQAIRLKPDYALAHHGLAITLEKQGKLTEAEAAYRQAIRINPDYALAHFGLAVALEKQGKRAEAEAAYRQAIRLKPDLPKAPFNPP